MLVFSTRCREPTGWPVATYSSTTRRRISCWRSVSSVRAGSPAISSTKCRSPPSSGQELCGHAAAEEAAALGERERRFDSVAATDDQPQLLEPLDRVFVEGAGQPAERERLVEPQAKDHLLLELDLGGQRLELARRSLACNHGLEVAADARRVSPAQAVDGRDRADPEAEVV